MDRRTHLHSLVGVVIGFYMARFNFLNRLSILKVSIHHMDTSLVQHQQKRVEILQHLGLLHDPSLDHYYDALVAGIQALCNVSVVSVNFYDDKHEHIKRNIGLNSLSVITLENSLSFQLLADRQYQEHAEEGNIHTISQVEIDPHKVRQMNDATQDSKYRNFNLVTDNPYVRFFGCVPFSFGDTVIGCIFVANNKPQVLNTRQKQVLVSLSKQVTELLQLYQTKREYLTALRSITEQSLFSENKTSILESVCTEVKERVYQSITILSYLSSFLKDHELLIFLQSLVAVQKTLASFTQNHIDYVWIKEDSQRFSSWSSSSVNSMVGDNLHKELLKIIETVQTLSSTSSDIKIDFQLNIDPELEISFDYEHFTNLLLHTVSLIIETGHRGTIYLRFLTFERDNDKTYLRCDLSPINAYSDDESSNFRINMQILKTIADYLQWTIQITSDVWSLVIPLV